MNQITNAKAIASKLDKRTDNEQIRISLYSIYVTIILSKDLFKKNIDIRLLSNELEIFFSDYVYKSRTLVTSRYVRIIEKADEHQLYLLLDVAKKILFPDVNLRVKLPAKKRSSIDQLLEQFGRD